MTRKSVNIVGRKQQEEAADDDAPVYRQIPGSGAEPLGFVDSSGADLVGFGSTTDVSLFNNTTQFFDPQILKKKPRKARS